MNAPREPFIVFLAELLAERRGSGGWVHIEQLAAAGVSRATAYRYLDAIEAAGILAIEHDPDYRRGGGPSRGVRANRYLARRAAPTHFQGNAHDRIDAAAPGPGGL